MKNVSTYTKEEMPILKYLADLMKETGLPVKHIHVLNELLKYAKIDHSELEAGRTLIITREYKNIVERFLEDNVPIPVRVTINDLQRASILQMWSNGAYRFNPDIFGRRVWYINGKPNLRAVKLVVKQGRKDKKLRTIKRYCGSLFWNRKVSTYRMAC